MTASSFTENLAQVLQPVAKARGLTNAHYVDDDVFALERDKLLFGSWAGVGFGKDIPEPGDAMPVEFLGMPILLLRNQEGEVKAYQNTCRHRGMILVREKGNIRGTIRCPYHSWCYGLDGALRATPHVGGPGHNVHEEIKRDELGLIPIRAYVFHDVIFVNVSGDAPEFEELHADLIARWGEFAKPLYHSGADSSFTLEVNCNWKLAVENYCESYHLPWVHPGLNSYSRLEDHYNIDVPRAYAGQGTLVYRQLEGEGGARFPDFEGLCAQWDAGAEYVALYPNVLLGVHRDHTFAIILEPLAKDRTREHIALYYAQPEVLGESYEALRRENTRLWKTVFEEDIFVVEGMQKGRNGLYFDGGKFAPAMDAPTHNFHDWAAARLADLPQAAE